MHANTPWSAFHATGGACGARLAHSSRESGRALASELAEGQVDAAGGVLARVGRAALWLSQRGLALLGVDVEDGVSGARHDVERSLQVAHDELVGVVREWELALWLHALAKVLSEDGQLG